MISSRVRSKIKRHEVVVTAKVCYGDPELVELIASAGFDAIWICQEHRRWDPSTVTGLIQACRLGGSDALIRVRPANYPDLLWLLEAGASGVMFPRVRNAAEARTFVEWTKFPPLGKRGCDLVHPDSDFGRASFREYVESTNREQFVVVQIEEPEVVAEIEAIAAIPGVDVLFVGPGDLTLGLGKFGQVDDEEIVAVVRRVAAACERNGKVAAIPCSVGQVKRYYDFGYRFFNILSDYRCVSNGIREAQAAFAALGLAI